MLRLQQTIGNQAVGSVLRGAALARHAVATTDIHRAKRDELFGDGTPANPGMTFSAFVRSTRAQADWFVEPSLSPTDRDDLWKLLRKSAEGSHILAGTGDLKLADLVAVTDAQWTDLANFGRACDAGGHTVRVLNRTAYALAKRVSLGGTLAALEAVIAPAVLELTVSELQLDKVDAGALVPKIDAYWKAFQPHLQRRYVPGPGAIGEEFKLVLDLVAGPGIALFGSLNGRIRNLHRFTLPTLVRQVINFANHTRAQPVQLVLHTGHDESSFTDQVKANLEDLVTNTPNLVLILEGQAHLKDITAAIPTIAADYGQPDKSGTPRIAQAMIAGHGEARMVEMAGTGAPNVHDNRVDYPKENLNLDDPVTSAETVKLMDTLVGNLDPATARLVFLGCLVGSNPVPLGTATADMAAHIAGRPSLATFAEQRGAAAGLAPGFTQASRASVGAKAAESLHDGKGNLAITYKFDPDAFGTALAYVATGREPEGLMRAAVEVAATDPLVAAHQLRLRQGLALPGWYGEMSMVAVNIALDGVAVGAPVDPQRLNKLAHMVGTPFLAYWSKQFGRNVSTFRAHVNPQGPLAGDMFKGIAATPTFAAADFNANVLRLIVEQAWIEFGEARQANLMAFLDATPALKAGVVADHLDITALGASSAALFPAAAAGTPGRIRLALAWLAKDPANPDVRRFLDGHVVAAGAAPPELDAAVKAQLDSYQEDTVLGALGRLQGAVPGGGGGGGADPLDAANAEVRKTGDNRVLVEPQPYEAIVVADKLNVRTLPHMGGRVFAHVSFGDTLRVAGFTHDWAGIDLGGKLGFVHRNHITDPP